MNNLEKAKELLNSSDFTCVCCNNEEIITSRKRGVAPLLEWLDERKCLKEYSVADKVVGNGAAFLYILLGLKELHANVISRIALETLQQHNILVNYNTLTEAICNRDNTGFCPIEIAVSKVTSPDKALIAIRNELKKLQNS